MKPLKFEPLLKSTIWGGNKIIAFKHLDIKQEKVGESWEISGVPGNESIVADGEMKGKACRPCRDIHEPGVLPLHNNSGEVHDSA